jgi:hypothetical protein
MNGGVMADAALPFSEKERIRVLERGNEQIVAVDELRRRFGVHALIRLHADDFALLTGMHRAFVHFNLEATLNEAGRRYAILPIIKPGKRLSDGREVLPVVDPTQFRRGLCIEVIQRLPVTSITEEQLTHSLPTIRTVETLRAALIRRYADMFPGLSNDEILARGCAVTRLVLDDQ